MKVEVLQENLSKALLISSRFIATKAQLPVLSNILLKATKTKLELLATNLEMSISIPIGAKTEEEGEIAVPAKTLVDIVSNLSHGSLTLESNKEQLEIKMDKFESQISGINTSDFPQIPTSLPTENIKLSSTDFLKALSKVLFSVSTEETRPVLTGVLFLFEESALRLVSSDGFRLSQKKIDIDKTRVKYKNVILPRLVLTEISRIAKEEPTEILLHVSEQNNQAIIGIGSIVLSTRIIEGSFPDFEKIIPTSTAVKIFLDKEELSRAVKLASVFARDAANIVKMTIVKETISVTAQSSRSGSQKMELDIRSEGDILAAPDVSYNYHFVEEFLNTVEGSEVRMELTGREKPGMFFDTKDASFLHLIMPVRVQS